MKKLVLTALFLLGALIIFASFACEGDQGAKGPQGTPGDDGPDAILEPPADRMFALAIFNSTKSDHNGASAVSLTFDSTALPSASVVVANKIKYPPIVDGVNEGTSVWGPKSSTITLSHQAFADNAIKSAKMIAAYDDYNIYFLIEWNEVKSGNFVIGENARHLDWSYSTESKKFVLNTLYEDRVSLMFQDSRALIDEWNAYGCMTGCHQGEGNPDEMASLSTSIYIDTWQWGAARCQNTGLGLDRVLASTGFLDDGGIGPINRNFVVNQTVIDEVQVFDSVPIFMHRLQQIQPNYIPETPIWDHYLLPYEASDTSIHWTATSYIPGWYNLTPSQGNDLLECKGSYSGGKWTVEFSRPRVTEDPYDVTF